VRKTSAKGDPKISGPTCFGAPLANRLNVLGKTLSLSGTPANAPVFIDILRKQAAS
jgi:hypothetical protein